MKNAKILVVMHQPYTSPEDKELYLPIQSGAAISNSLGIQTPIMKLLTTEKERKIQ